MSKDDFQEWVLSVQLVEAGSPVSVSVLRTPGAWPTIAMPMFPCFLFHCRSVGIIGMHHSISIAMWALGTRLSSSNVRSQRFYLLSHLLGSQLLLFMKGLGIVHFDILFVNAHSRTAK